MISAALLAWLAATADTGCESTCSIQSNACYTQCVGADRCTARCGVRQTECIAGCDKDRSRRKQGKREKKSAPCEVSLTGAARPCSEKERATMKKALSSRQAKSVLCRDATGNLVACEDDLQFAQAQYDKQLAKCTAGSKAPECRLSDSP